MQQINILSPEQKDLIPLVKRFSLDYYLVGGTALALQLGHRRSIDFDLFTKKEFDNDHIIKVVEEHYPIESIYVNSKNELTLAVHGVKMTWYKYDYQVPVTEEWDKVIKMPDVLKIGCMKAFAVGRRAKWKDYVDLFFIFKHHSFKQLVKATSEIFSESLFDEILLRSQLSYFEDIDYKEKVEYMSGFFVKDSEIKEVLSDLASRE